MNDCLEQLDLEDDYSSDMMSFDRLNTSLKGDFIPNSSMAKVGIQSSPHLFTEEMRQTEGSQSSPQINLEAFREKIKAALI